MRHLPIAIITLAAISTVVSVAPGQAQLMDQLKGAVGGGMLGGLGGGAMPSVGQASTGNTAGVLQYCIQNNYVGGSGASSVKDSLMRKVTGQGTDSGYKQGSSGLLQTGAGQSYSLGGGGIKQQITQKVCDQILQHAKSLL